MNQDPKDKEIRRELSAMRRQYGDSSEIAGDIPLSPFKLFNEWLTQAIDNSFIVEPNAMVLSTDNGNGPIARTVLMKEFSERGIVFYSNYNSRKAKGIARDSRVSLLFPWYAMERQIIIQGRATKLSASESDLYFDLRPYSSQIGAWASNQSSEISDRKELENKFEFYALKYPAGKPVPRPETWGGFLVIPTLFEFWQGRNSRLHDRILYSLNQDANGEVGINWVASRLNP